MVVRCHVDALQADLKGRSGMFRRPGPDPAVSSACRGTTHSQLAECATVLEQFPEH